MAEERHATKTEQARERVEAAARSLAGPKTFLVGFTAILAIILIVQNWAPVRISVFGVTFDLPGILWYALLFLCGALVGVWWEGRRRNQ